MRLLPAVVLSCLLAGPAAAAWTNSPVLNTPLASGTGAQQAPAVVPDGSGGTLIVWQDYRNGNADLYAQHLDAQGNALWAANGVAICNNVAYQDSPGACSDGAGGMIVTWYDYRSGYTDIYTQRVNGSGVSLWAVNGLAICNAADYQFSNRVISDGAGGAFVSWTDYRTQVTNSSDIYVQHVQANGAMAWTPNGVPACTASGTQSVTGMAVDGSGGVVLTWYDNRTPASSNDIYAQRINSGGYASWTANGVVVCNAVGDQFAYSVVTDGTGTVFVAWGDYRAAAGGTNWDIYAQAISPAGSALWGSNGLALCTNGAQQRYPYMALDGVGGVFVVWTDTRAGTVSELYGQHVSSGGYLQWAADGQLLLTASAGGREANVVLPDGAGGFLVAYKDSRYGFSDDYFAQRFNSAGAQVWTSGGVALCTNPAMLFHFTAASDGQGGLVAAVAEDRTGGGNYDLFAQRVDRYGYLGQTEPIIADVGDVPGDQGGRVKLSFYGSYLEDEPWYALSAYYVYRSLPALATAAAVQRGELRATTDAGEAALGRAVYTNSYSGQSYFWELLTTLSPNYTQQYSVYAATAQDSIAGSRGRVAFMVQARSGSKHWDSAPDSGYSVDNLAPAAPAPLTAQYSAGAARLHWNPNAESDLAGYRLYRGTSTSFTPGPGTFVAELADTGHTDAAGAPYVYKLTAVDLHGNESPVATVTPAGTTGVAGGAAPPSLAFALSSANPVHGAVTLQLALPVAARVRVAVYDAAGREVRLLLAGECGAGARTMAWDGADAAGRGAPSGLYFARLEAGGTARVSRFVLAR